MKPLQVRFWFAVLLDGEYDNFCQVPKLNLLPPSNEHARARFFYRG